LRGKNVAQELGWVPIRGDSPKLKLSCHNLYPGIENMYSCTDQQLCELIQKIFGNKNAMKYF
jgi:hypothetical protein